MWNVGITEIGGKELESTEQKEYFFIKVVYMYKSFAKSSGRNFHSFLCKRLKKIISSTRESRLVRKNSLKLKLAYTETVHAVYRFSQGDMSCH